MRFTTILLGAVLLFAVTSSRRAEACGGGGGGDYGGIIVAAVVVGGAYVGTTATFAIKDVATSNHSMGYGVAETAINAPIALMFGAAFIKEVQDPNTDHGAAKTLGVFTALHGALMAHGIYTIVKKSRHHGDQAAPRRYDGPPGAMQVGPVTAVVSPAR